VLPYNQQPHRKVNSKFNELIRPCKILSFLEVPTFELLKLLISGGEIPIIGKSNFELILLIWMTAIIYIFGLNTK
jgi:hypothetical protein